METGGNNADEGLIPKRITVEDTEDNTGISATNEASCNPPWNSANFNLTVPVRHLYHEQAKSIIAIQVRHSLFFN